MMHFVPLLSRFCSCRCRLFFFFFYRVVVVPFGWETEKAQAVPDLPRSELQRTAAAAAAAAVQAQAEAELSRVLLLPWPKPLDVLTLVNTPRCEWPLKLLKRVHRKLGEGVPKGLLERELWLSSVSPSEWFAKQSKFAGSLSVMSVLGSVLGLGDRHLDNLLMDFSSGQVVHIDYG
eukprot:CAMPEP_0171675344 /NCGR_PEP_ID=MMETSP0990-20121206/53761_1 /TAXON_ID=483369 /ORGANISM="non described non described, Strain CCMP2098" /LENGTH=175 /DNA_ID=CAMNT_0012261271 /DNA_START=131 /DNA_END=654 /DNA_ORIENTATION=+